jgi:hypothetical protein
MARQVQQRRTQVAAEQEAERQRQIAAAQERQWALEAEQRRRADREAMWGTIFQGALMIGQAAVQAQAEVNAQQAELNRLGMAAAEETRQNQERAAAEQRAAENEHARQVAEAQFAQQRANQQRQADQTANQAATRAQAEAQERERREMAERRAAEQRAEQQAQADREAREAREAQQRAEAEARAREAEARRRQVEQERQAREAERNRLVDYREGVVLCELTGPQAQFGNWRCTGPLQWTYVKIGSAQENAQLLQACGGGTIRELGTVGVYRAYGCGFGVHPTNGGALSNVPESMGVEYVPGRITFRCPISSTNTCRTR